MSKSVLTNFSIEIDQTLYEEKTVWGTLAVYETATFGKLLSINGQVHLSEADGFYYHEMMAHPVLFSHEKPQHIVIIGNYFGILQEVLKHPSVKQVTCITENNQIAEAIGQFFSPLFQSHDTRVKYQLVPPTKWLAESKSELFDIMILNEPNPNPITTAYAQLHRILDKNGILVTPCESSLLYLQNLKITSQTIKRAGFNNWQILNFPQPSYPAGFRTVMMATKQPIFRRPCEKAIYNRQFNTRFYNYDVHKAALVLPEFMRHELEI